MSCWQIPKSILAVVVLVVATGCGGGGGGGGVTGPPNATVQVSWAANRDAAVNQAGGGYRVYFSRIAGFNVAGASFVDVPYVSGPTAPTAAALALSSGNNFIKIVAYSALNPNGSAPSAETSVSVPFAVTSVANTP
jgi:hypothetical protein